MAEDPNADASAAWSRFEALIERSEVGLLKRSMQVGADLTGGLLSQSTDDHPVFYKGHFRYRVVVKDRISGEVVREQDWGFDTRGAQEAFEETKSALDRMTVAEFCQEYEIGPIT